MFDRSIHLQSCVRLLPPLVRHASFAEWGARLGWQARAASGRCIFPPAGEGDLAPADHADASALQSVSFHVSATGSITCTDESDSDTRAGDEPHGAQSQSSHCASALAAILHVVTRRVDLSSHAAEGRVTELLSLDNEHLPMAPRVAVLMTGQLRTFKHAVN